MQTVTGLCTPGAVPQALVQDAFVVLSNVSRLRLLAPAGCSCTCWPA